MMSCLSGHIFQKSAKKPILEIRLRLTLEMAEKNIILQVLFNMEQKVPMPKFLASSARKTVCQPMMLQRTPYV